MKILHTADWHIGKQLHKVDLQEEHMLFFDWLLRVIKDEKIDLLLVSGDVFETSTPSNQSRKVYHDFLKRLFKTNTKVVITGGNHDSISQLETTKEILELLDVTIVGGIPSDIDDLLVEIQMDNGDQPLIIAAVPFLRDRDIRVAVEKESITDKENALKEGLARYFQSVSTRVKEKYPDSLSIGMGHLYMQGVSTSDSERSIGNQTGVSVHEFAGLFDYLALGHIHKPQVFEDGAIQYSGSPICLSFSERKNDKRVVLLSIEDGVITSEHKAVPKFRDVLKIQGTLDVVICKLQQISVAEESLLPLVEVEVLEDKYNLQTIVQLQQVIEGYQAADFRIVKDRITFTENQANITALFEQGEKIEDLSPEEVFDRKIGRSNIEEDDKKIIKTAFREILDSFQD